MEDKTELWVCAGRRLYQDGPAIIFYPIVDGELSTESIAFAKVKAYCGNIYKVQVVRDGTKVSIRGKVVFERPWPDRQMAATWSAEQATAQGLEDARRAEKKQDDPLVELLLPLTKTYHRSVGPGRRALLTRIVEIIVSGKGTD